MDISSSIPTNSGYFRNSKEESLLCNWPTLKYNFYSFLHTYIDTHLISSQPLTQEWKAIFVASLSPPDLELYKTSAFLSSFTYRHLETLMISTFSRDRPLRVLPVSVDLLFKWYIQTVLFSDDSFACSMLGPFEKQNNKQNKTTETKRKEKDQIRTGGSRTPQG